MFILIFVVADHTNRVDLRVASMQARQSHAPQPSRLLIGQSIQWCSDVERAKS
jgi:hypothetical protein